MAQDLFGLVERTRNDVNAHEFANSAGRHGAGFGRRFHGSDITPDKDSHIAIEQIFFADQHNIRGLDHGIGCFHSADETTRFNHP